MDQVFTRPIDIMGVQGMPTPEQIWADADLPTRRLAGLALNPSVPESILLRLLSDAPLAVRMVLCRDRILPDAVVDAVIEHPDAYTRSFFARNPHVDPAQRVRLLDDPEWFVRAHLAHGPRVAAPAQPRPLPDEAIVHMISTYDDELLGGPLYQQISARLRQSMPTHPVAKVRRWGVGGWASLSAEMRAALLTDPDAGVRETAQRHARSQDPAWVESALPDRPCHARTDMLLHHALSRAVVDGVLAKPVDEEDKAMIAVNPSLPPDMVVLLAADPVPQIRGLIAHRADLGPAERHALVADPDPDVRTKVAYRADLGPAERRVLMTDPHPDVRLAVSLHPALSEEERAQVDYQAPMNHSFVFHPAPGVPRDPETVRRDALSNHPCFAGRQPGTTCCRRTSSPDWPPMTTSAYASCSPKTIQTLPRHYCCAASSSTPDQSAAASPPGRTSRPADWPLSPTTRTLRSEPWPHATPKQGRQPWNGSPMTRNMPCGLRRRATRIFRSPGWHYSSTRRSWPTLRLRTRRWTWTRSADC